MYHKKFESTSYVQGNSNEAFNRNDNQMHIVSSLVEWF